MGRSYQSIIENWRIITKEIGADIVVLDMPLLDTRNKKDLLGTFLSDVVLALLGYVSQNEREMIKKRQAEGIKAAKARGVKFGRTVKKPPKNFMDLVKKWRRAEMELPEVLTKCKFSESTFYRRIKGN